MDLEFLANTFTEENVIEPIVNYYKSFDYVNYIMGSIFFDGYKLYKICIDRIKDKQEMILDDRLWLLYLLELNNGYTGNYDDYKKSKLKPVKQSKHENDVKEQELIDKYKNLDQTKFIQKRL